MLFTAAHALVIGVGSYKNVAAANVPITVADAQAVAQILIDPQLCGYPQEQVCVLYDESATRDGILNALDDLATKTGPNGTILLFYAGHGEYGTDGLYYLSSYDIEVAKGKIVAGTGVSEKELLERFQKLKAQRLLLIFNACHAGNISSTLDLDTSLAKSLPDATAAAVLATGQGRAIITACRADQLSHFDKDTPATIFTSALLAGLHGNGVMNRNGGISVFDLYSQAYDSVTARVKPPRGVQQPELTVQQGRGAMIVALYPGTQTATMGLSTELPQSLPMGKAVREVSAAESRQQLQQIIRGNRNITISGTMNGGTNTGGDQVNMGSGDYVRGNQDKRSGAFISGGTVYGPVVGSNSGSITTSYGLTPGSTAASPLQQAITAVEQAIVVARQRGSADTAEDLAGVLVSLRAALTAEEAKNTIRRASKLQTVQSALRELAAADPTLQSLLLQVQQLQ